MQTHGMRLIDLADVLAEFRAGQPAVEVHIRHAAGGLERDGATGAGRSA
jgi:hypothetical protein